MVSHVCIQSVSDTKAALVSELQHPCVTATPSQREGNIWKAVALRSCSETPRRECSRLPMPIEPFLQNSLTPGLAAVMAGYECNCIGMLGGASGTSAHGSYNNPEIQGLGTDVCMHCCTFPEPRMTSISTYLVTDSN